MAKLAANPFFVYIIAFGTVLLVYSLGWSELYPDLSVPLVGFLLLTFLVSFFFGVLIHVLRRIEYREIQWSANTNIYLILVWLGYGLEFVYNRGIPILMLLSGKKYDYTLFGIPTFHVFLVTFGSFVSIYMFHQLCSEFTKRRLALFLFSLVPPILIINRGMLLMILTSCLFVYLLSLKRASARNLIVIAILVLVVFFLFGIMGNFRQNDGKNTSSEIILETAKATESFKQSIVPKPYIWPYIYISSPLANLENNIEKAENLESHWIEFVNFEILPDFISKRTAKIFSLTRKSPKLIAPWLTVATIYTNPYLYLGWIGLVLIYGYFLITSLIYFLVLRKSSKYYVTGLAILNTVVLFNTFDNMYYFSGLSLQLIYPVVFSMMGSLKLNRSASGDSLVKAGIE